MPTASILGDATEPAAEARKAKRTERASAPKPALRPLCDNGLELFEGGFQCDAKGGLIKANAVLAGILGYKTAEELVQAVPNIWRRLASDKRTVSAVKDALRAKGRVEDMLVETTHKDGRPIKLSLSAQAKRRRGSCGWSASGVVRDVTEERSRLEKLERDFRDLESLLSG